MNKPEPLVSVVINVVSVWLFESGPLGNKSAISVYLMAPNVCQSTSTKTCGNLNKCFQTHKNTSQLQLLGSCIFLQIDRYCLLALSRSMSLLRDNFLVDAHGPNGSGYFGGPSTEHLNVHLICKQHATIYLMGTKTHCIPGVEAVSMAPRDSEPLPCFVGRSQQTKPQHWSQSSQFST